MKLSAIFLGTTTDLSTSSFDWGLFIGILGFVVGVLGLWATCHFYYKEKSTRLSNEILFYAYKFSLFNRGLINKVNANTWHKGRKGSELQAEIRVLCTEANPFLHKLKDAQKQSLECKLAKVTEYLTSFITGTNESKDEMLKRMNEVDKYLQQLTEETKK